MKLDLCLSKIIHTVKEKHIFTYEELLLRWFFNRGNFPFNISSLASA